MDSQCIRPNTARDYSLGGNVSPSQLLCLLVLCKTLREARRAIANAGYSPERADTITSYLALLIDKAADYDTAFCRWISQTEAVADTFGRQALAMVWDFEELNPFGPFGSNLQSLIQTICDAVTVAVVSSTAASVSRGTATDLPWPEMSVDAPQARRRLYRVKEEVQPELERIVRERVKPLWEMGISGADLVIACVGAGLRAFTRFARVDYANGEEVPAQRLLTEVETVVLQTILARLSKEVAATAGLQRLGGESVKARLKAWCWGTGWLRKSVKPRRV